MPWGTDESATNENQVTSAVMIVCNVSYNRNLVHLLNGAVIGVLDFHRTECRGFKSLPVPPRVPKRQSLQKCRGFGFPSSIDFGRTLCIYRLL